MEPGCVQSDLLRARGGNSVVFVGKLLAVGFRCGWSAVGACGECQLDFIFFCAGYGKGFDSDGDGIADVVFLDDGVECVDIGNGLVVDGDDDIAGDGIPVVVMVTDEAGFFCRGVGVDSRDSEAGPIFATEAELTIFESDAEHGLDGSTVVDELGDDSIDLIYWY